MRAVVSRVKYAKVRVDGKVVGKCDKGLLILSCFTEGDGEKEVEYVSKKCASLRIFDDENGVMNKSVTDIGGSILSISQFTLYADVSNGNRPSYIKALKGEKAIKLYDAFSSKLSSYVPTEKGVFGADMQIETMCDGPVTIIVDSK